MSGPVLCIFLCSYYVLPNDFPKGLYHFIMPQTSTGQGDLFPLDFKICLCSVLQAILICWDKTCFIEINKSLNAWLNFLYENGAVAHFFFGCSMHRQHHHHSHHQHHCRVRWRAGAHPVFCGRLPGKLSVHGSSESFCICSLSFPASGLFRDPMWWGTWSQAGCTRNWSEVGWEPQKKGVEAEAAKEEKARQEGPWGSDSAQSMASLTPQFCSIRVPPVDKQAWKDISMVSHFLRILPVITSLKHYPLGQWSWTVFLRMQHTAHSPSMVQEACYRCTWRKRLRLEWEGTAQPSLTEGGILRMIGLACCSFSDAVPPSPQSQA